MSEETGKTISSQAPPLRPPVAPPKVSCPKCQSMRVFGVGIADKTGQELSLPTPAILAYKKCKDCQHVWGRVPTWLLAITFVIGILLFSPLGYLLVEISRGNSDAAGAVVFVGFVTLLALVLVVGSFRGILVVNRARLRS